MDKHTHVENIFYNVWCQVNVGNWLIHLSCFCSQQNIRFGEFICDFQS